MSSQEQHLRQWIKSRRRENLKQFVMGVAFIWLVGAAILGPVFWLAGR